MKNVNVYFLCEEEGLLFSSSFEWFKEIANGLPFNAVEETGLPQEKEYPYLVVSKQAFICDRDVLEEILSLKHNTTIKKEGKSIADFYNCKGESESEWEISSDRVFLLDNASKRFRANEIMQKTVIEYHLENGVDFLSADGIIISPTVKIEPTAKLLTGTILKGKTQIGKGSVVGPNSLLDDCIVMENSVFNASQGYSSTIKSNVSIGPFCHIRPNSVIENGVHLGDFVEIKNSTLGEDTHVSHLTYVGDSDVGKRVNFGCGVVTVNYNGVTKARCKIGDDVFVGCNTNLVAPVTLGNSAYTAAGSTITEDIPADSFAIARSRQITRENYNMKIRGKKYE